MMNNSMTICFEVEGMANPDTISDALGPVKVVLTTDGIRVGVMSEWNPSRPTGGPHLTPKGWQQVATYAQAIVREFARSREAVHE